MDLLDRLRSDRHLTQGHGLEALLDTGEEAAKEIERLRAALYEIVGLNHHNMGQESRATQIARAALAKDESE